MNRNRRGVFTFLLLIILMSACSGVNSTDPPAIQGITWVLVEIKDRTPITETRVTLMLEDGQVSGNAGCNIYQGSYEANGDSITITDIFNTEMGCTEPVGVMEQEGEYLEFLRRAERLELAGDSLTIFSDQEQRLSFVAQEAAAQAEPTTPVPAAPPTSAPTSTLMSLPPAGFKEYVDDTAEIAIAIPESWYITGIIEGEFAILQSYPEDKYIGGEQREPGDTKCDLSWRPEEVGVEAITAQWESDSMTTIISEQEVTLASGEPALRFELNSMGPANVLLAELDGRVVTLTCFGDFSLFDEIAATITSK